MSNTIQHITDGNFEEQVLQAELPVLVDFWAEWCVPCKAIAPILEEIVTDYEEKIRIVKLNVDENRKSPARYGIRGIPTLIIFRNGHVEATHIGALTKSQLSAFINQNI